jgi:NRPS condensation-like uncharacterized protein
VTSASRPIPSRFRVAAGDLVIYLSRFANDIVIRAVVTLAGRADEQRLRHALRLLLDAAPIAGCRYVERRWRPHFRRLETVDEAALLQVLPAYGPGDPETTLTRYLLEPFEPFDGPLLRAALIRGVASTPVSDTGASDTGVSDTLCLKAHHLFGDGAGVVEALYLLAELYAALEGDPDYAPTPNVDGDRSLRQVARQFPRGPLWRAQGHAAPPLGSDPRWALDLAPGADGPPAFITRAQPAGRLAAVRAYAHAHSATVNDVLLAAWYRAVYRLVQPPAGTPLAVATHINLRRHLPGGRAGAIANLSQMVSTNIGVELGATLADTMALVQAEMARVKAAPPSLALPLLLKVLPYGWVQRLFDAVAARLAQSERPVFAGTLFNNVGALDPARLTLSAPVTNAYLTACVPTGSGLQVVVGTCGEQLYVNALLREIGGNRRVLETLLDYFDQELGSTSQEAR